MGNKSSSMLRDEEIKNISEETGFSPTQIEKLYSRFAHLDRGSCGSLTKGDLMSIPELAINPLCDRLIQMFFADCDQEDERINFKQFMRVLATFRSTNNNNNETVISTTNIANTPKAFTTARGRNETSIISKNTTTISNRQQQDNVNTISSSNKNITNDYNTCLDGLNSGLRDKLLFVFRIYDADNDGRISFNDLKCILKMMVGSYIEDVQLDKIAIRAFVEVDEDNDGFIEFSEFCKVFRGKDLDDKLRVKFFN